MAVSLKEAFNEVEYFEIESLLEVIYRRYGYDFRDYVQGSVARRLQWRKQQWKLANIADMIPLIIHSKNHFNVLLTDMSIAITEMYRDPHFFNSMINDVFPVLKTFPFFKIWHAGCASGEEVYSLAILLHEHGLYERSQIYATDFNMYALNTAKQGIYSNEKISGALESYKISGGQGLLTDYFVSSYGNSMINDVLKKRITFAAHNLVIDGVFGEMELIICRNVMIYFNNKLKTRVVKLFSDSLFHGGFLCLGDKESLSCLDNDDLLFEPVNAGAKIFKKNSIL